MSQMRANYYGTTAQPQLQSGYNTPLGPSTNIGAAGLQSIPDLMIQLQKLINDPQLQ